MVLLRDDGRVQQTFAEWRARHGDWLRASVELMHELTQHWAEVATSPEALMRTPGVGVLIEDMRQLKALTSAIGLEKVPMAAPDVVV